MLPLPPTPTLSTARTSSWNSAAPRPTHTEVATITPPGVALPVAAVAVSRAIAPAARDPAVVTSLAKTVVGVVVLPAVAASLLLSLSKRLTTRTGRDRCSVSSQRINR